jgi:hypothetical protein
MLFRRQVLSVSKIGIGPERHAGEISHGD